MEEKLEITIETLAALQEFIDSNFKEGRKKRLIKTASSLKKADFDFDEKCTKAVPTIPQICCSISAEMDSVDNFIEKTLQKQNFQNLLQQHIANKNLANAEIYKKAYVDKKLFSKIITIPDYIPKKETVIALGLALELEEADFNTFLSTAGFSLHNDSVYDIIIRYCVLNKIYSLLNVDFLLSKYDQKCFSAK